MVGENGIVNIRVRTVQVLSLYQNHLYIYIASIRKEMDVY